MNIERTALERCKAQLQRYVEELSQEIDQCDAGLADHLSQSRQQIFELETSLLSNDYPSLDEIILTLQTAMSVFEQAHSGPEQMDDPLELPLME